MTATLIILLILFFSSFGIKIFTKIKPVPILENMITPFVVGVLLVIAILHMITHPTVFMFCIMLGLLFSLIGDMFLLSKSLLEGGVFFIITHICYVIAFILLLQWNFKVIFVLIILLGILVLIYQKIYPKLLTLQEKIGIAVYMVTISIMTSLAIDIYYGSMKATGLFIGIGALLFWISDLIIIIDKYIKTIKYEGVVVWSTYAIGQFLIVYSIILI